MSISCQLCHKNMPAVIYHGAKSRFCLACKYFFLLPAQLQQIKTNSDINLDDDALKTLPGAGTSSVRCPSCEGSMRLKSDGKIVRTDVEVCDDCNGIWLSKTALTRIEYDSALVQRNRDKNQGKRMTCPKCGLEQVGADNCKRCQVVINKYVKAKKEGRTEYKKLGFFEKLGKQLEAKIEGSKRKHRHVHTRTSRFLDACQHNRFSFFLMKLCSWALVLVVVFLGWLALLYIFSHIAAPPPRPAELDLAEARVSIFYIFAIAMTGPVLFVITFIIWRLFWYGLYGPIMALTHKYFHPLIKPTIAIGLMLLILQDISVFARGFWATYWWFDHTVQDAKANNDRPKIDREALGL